jgi:hypothetical protein
LGFKLIALEVIGINIVGCEPTSEYISPSKPLSNVGPTFLKALPTFWV